HRRIALLAGPAAGWTAPLQLAGYRGQLARLGIAFNPRLVRIGPSRPDHAAASLTALLALAEPPGAVIAGDPAMALGAIGAMAEAKLRYPRDLSLLCLEDADWMAPLGLGAASWSPDRIAATAVGLLFERIARPTAPIRRATIAAALDPRRSCARPVAAGRG
ncbi:MAG: substrate-binding domain-containing protein, partial [Alphaproteobacteria bacterium]|nr:substrate-binding domain-containing protein [Alphaproteobacteria bacterium]